MSESQVQRAVDVLVADWLRQGEHLDQDQINRTLERRGLVGADAEAVLRALAEQGLEIVGIDPRDVGFEPRYAITAASAGADYLDPLGLFFKDMSAIRLLTADDEQRLGRRITLGKGALRELEDKLGESAVQTREIALAKQFKGIDTLASEDPAIEQYSPILVRQLRDGRAALLHLVVANIRLVIYVARRYSRISKLELLDLIQEGALGLIRAAEKFDASLGYKFSTYATWWIRQAVQRAVANSGSTVRIPVHVHDERLRLRKMQRALWQEYGREPSFAELVDHLEWDAGQVAAILDLDKFNLASIDSIVSSDGSDVTMGDLVADPFSINPEDAAIDTLLREAVESSLRRLSQRESEVIRCRFGLLGDEVQTLEDIGDRLGLTRERIRQIQNRALEKLSRPPHARELVEFLDRTSTSDVDDGSSMDKLTEEGES